jgi:hypothetical protein
MPRCDAATSVASLVIKTMLGRAPDARRERVRGTRKKASCPTRWSGVWSGSGRSIAEAPSTIHSGPWVCHGFGQTLPREPTGESARQRRERRVATAGRWLASPLRLALGGVGTIPRSVKDRAGREGNSTLAFLRLATTPCAEPGAKACESPTRAAKPPSRSSQLLPAALPPAPRKRF